MICCFPAFSRNRLLRARLSGHFSHARSKWLLAVGVSQAHFSPGRGTSCGIGRAIAADLARTHRVVATYRGRLDAAESLAAYTGAATFQCAMARAADRQTVMDFSLITFGRVDLLVNNAGMGQRERRDVLEATVESFDESRDRLASG